MLNYIWFAMMAIALIVAAVNGTAQQVTTGALESAKTAVEISIGLIGVMALWLGIMKIAERAGIVSMLARAIKPITRILFPEIPPDHPAIGAMIMNVAANMLGLGNAATPLGIKAMEELQELNEDKETASNSMVKFMVMNTTSPQLIPATVIAVLAAAGAKNPTSIIGSSLIATLTAWVSAVTIARIIERFVPGGSPRSGASDAKEPDHA